MTKISRDRDCLRTAAQMRDDESALREIIFFRSSSRLRKPMGHRSAGPASALDKIPPLSHLHNPQHLADLRWGAGAFDSIQSARSDRVTQDWKIEIGKFAVNQG